MLVGAIFYIVVLAILAGHGIASDPDLQDPRGGSWWRSLVALMHAARLALLSIPPVAMLTAYYGSWAAAAGLAATIGLSLAFRTAWQMDFRQGHHHKRQRGWLVFSLKTALGLYMLQLLVAAILLVVPTNLEERPRAQGDAQSNWVPIWKGTGPSEHAVPLVGIMPMLDPYAYYVVKKVDGANVIVPLRDPPVRRPES